MSEHNEECNCGNHDEDALTVTLTLDNDEVVECSVLTIYKVADREYIALLPLDDNGDNEEGDVFIYRFSQNGENDEPTLDNIEDDDEYDAAADAFDEWLDQQEFDELDEEE